VSLQNLGRGSQVCTQLIWKLVWLRFCTVQKALVVIMSKRVDGHNIFKNTTHLNTNVKHLSPDVSAFVIITYIQSLSNYQNDTFEFECHTQTKTFSNTYKLLCTNVSCVYFSYVYYPLASCSKLEINLYIWKVSSISFRIITFKDNSTGIYYFRIFQ